MTQTLRRADKGLGKTANGGSGGSFATHERDAPESPRERMERMYAEGGADLTYDEDYERVLEIAQRKAMSYDGRWVDRDDITQDAVVRVLDQAQKRGFVDVSKEAKDGGRAGVIAQAVTHSIVRVKHQGEHHTAVSGRKRLNERRQEREAALGRPLTSQEVETLANDVRLNDFAPGRRPAPGYHVLRVDSLSTEERDDDGRLTNYGVLSTNDVYPSEAPYDDSAPLGRLLDRFEAGKLRSKEEREAEGGITVAEARKRLWRAYREQNPEIPELVTLDAPHRTASRQAIDSAGGAYEASRLWLKGEHLDTETQDALFAPWGGSWEVRDDQKDAIAEKIAANQTFSDHLWSAALGLPSRTTPAS